MKSTGILIVSFGSSKPRAREKGIESVVTYLKSLYPQYKFISAYTSNFVRGLLQQEGEYVPSVGEALEVFKKESYTSVIILPLHVLKGYEYEKILLGTVTYKQQGLEIVLGEPLLGEPRGILEVAKRLMLVDSQYHHEYDQMLYIGHGTEHEAHAAYEILENELNKLGLSAVVGTIEEGPKEVLHRLKGKSVCIRPLLLVAGEHVEEDILGDAATSWVQVLRDAGVTVTYRKEGLGELPLIQELFYQRLKKLLVDKNEIETYIQDPVAIEVKSFEMIEEEMDNPKLPPTRLNIMKRVIHTTTDFGYEKRLVFKEGVEDVMLKGIREGCLIVTDTKMIQTGINKTLLNETPSQCLCLIQEPSVAQRSRLLGITRSMAAIDEALEYPGKKLFVIGNAPTAIFRLLERYPQYQSDILGVIGVPVGFVGAAESKEALWASPLPAIVAQGRPGGSTVGVAIINALLKSDVTTTS